MSDFSKNSDSLEWFSIWFDRHREPQGKKFGSDQMEDGGEVTDEDEGAETNRTRAGRVGQASRRLRICRELSDLIALNRGSSIKLPSSRDKSKKK